MPPKFSASQPHSASKQKARFLIFIFLVSLTLFLFVVSVKHQNISVVNVITGNNNNLETEENEEQNAEPEAWFDVIAKGLNSKTKIKVGLVNIDARMDIGNVYEKLYEHPQVEIVPIRFDRVDGNLKWNDFFPEWIDEDGKWGQPKCPEMPMPEFKNYGDLNVVMAVVPCNSNNRDVFGLQVNLVVANLAVENGWLEKLQSSGDHRKVYVVFVGSCGPMVEIFRCEDLLMRQGDYWVYKPDLKRLKQKMLMPVGSCQIASSFAETGTL